jgi:DNA invertase Pin-like site-specific DNA recombinase
MRLVAYVRVSTARQAGEGAGLQVQEAEIRAFCEREGHDLVEVFTDAGLSGTLPPPQRPALTDAMSAVCERLVDGLAVQRLDRLARELTNQEAILTALWQCGGRVFTADHGEVLQDDPDDPMRSAMRKMQAVFAELERGLIGARMRAGKRLREQQGDYIGGAPPFGFVVSQTDGHKALVPDPDPDVRATLARMVELREEGESLRTIAAMLNDEGRPTKRGGEWSGEQVRRTLTYQ